MQEKIRFYILLLIVISICLWQACDDNSCIQILDNSAKIGFISSVTDEDTLIDRLTVSSTGNDSILLNNASDTSELNLPLSPNTDLTEFILNINYIDSVDDEITYSHDIADTISLRYNTNPKYISFECGFVMTFKIQELIYTHNNIDSITIVASDSLIDTEDAEHFKIYF